MTQSRTWLAFANESKCNHRKALETQGFISWTTNIKSKFVKDDIIYLFMGDERAIRYRLKVDEVNIPREDMEFWIVPAPTDLTYRLTLIDKYEGNMLNEDILKRVGFNGGRSILNPIYNNPILFEYINGIFEIASRSIKLPSHYIIVDLGSGSHCVKKSGHEALNLIPNPYDGRFYGYIPPLDNPNILNLGASVSDDYVDNVMVVYVTKEPNSNNRKIIAFTDNAKVYAKSQPGRSLNRYILEDGKRIECSYTIESDYIYDLQSESDPFIFEVHGADSGMFRYQRFYTGRRPKQEVKMLLWLTDYIKRCINSENNDLLFQTKIQETEIATSYSDTSKLQPCYSHGSSGKTVAKKAYVSKQALRLANFKCVFDENHETFLTNKGVPYMEGHHLIPCTTSNTEYIWSKYGINIDCVENIVSLCPTCHRRIHFGCEEEKETIIRQLYQKRINSLNAIGIDISINELLTLYR